MTFIFWRERHDPHRHNRRHHPHRIIEAEGPEFEIGFLLPDAAIAPYRDWMEPDFLEPGTSKLIMATSPMC